MAAERLARSQQCMSRGHWAAARCRRPFGSSADLFELVDRLSVR
jgi:hypothetical protein